MGILTNKLILIIGIALIVCSIIAAIIYIFIIKIRKVKLNAQFDAEYGQEDIKHNDKDRKE